MTVKGNFYFWLSRALHWCLSLPWKFIPQLKRPQVPIQPCGSHAFNLPWGQRTQEAHKQEDHKISQLKTSGPLTHVAQLAGHRPTVRGTAGSIPGRDTCLGCRLGSRWGCVWEATDPCSLLHRSFFPSLLPPFSLSKNKYIKSFKKWKRKLQGCSDSSLQLDRAQDRAEDKGRFGKTSNRNT